MGGVALPQLIARLLSMAAWSASLVSGLPNGRVRYLVHAKGGYPIDQQRVRMAAVGGGNDLSTEGATLGANRAKSRFGVAYVRAVCSQAGVGFDETSPDEDVLAVDGSVEFEFAPARVQVKCTGQFRIKGGTTATWPVDGTWRRRWKRSGVPVYFVLVIVDPDEPASWLHHQDTATLHRAAAFWVRVDAIEEEQNIVVPKTQRFTADTLRVWAADVEASFDGSRGGGADV
ncbi:DUF4365 domain-containing protein [Amycolatopsis sp. PS_44_ISF1]|uniref:DUF4365 domain-containing protein n=1 Tax=Amycolatopsis sp. PS_44_ISF1 TaxID=2974917 RepID=UPI0028DE0B51|nr:DUF4365 domain-containing protein [Amycolatopsis sp. PS_44_ISF1]MDT8913729.1 DUF4365 domain-containing protein [Amycolatopsis sp. PS_44_ISF1]MDT8916210.1 DUF4365 domain-containing protein [Amycolatopsis sp. PS_44_ISF1]